METIILNRATRSLTLYFQMIGRGSRILPNKEEFTVIDMGNNVARFGMWDAPIDWQEIFHFPDFFLENIKNDEEIEREFVYEMPAELKAKFGKSKEIEFDARILAKQLKEEISYRVRQYSYCIMNNTKNYKEWLEEDYERRLRSSISKKFAARM